MQAPSEIVRTTIDQVGIQSLPRAGVYVIAYLGRVVYVGMTSSSVGERLRQHCYLAEPSDLGEWLGRVRDWENIRLDVLVPPEGVGRKWLKSAERACIRQFTPLLNRSRWDIIL